MLPTSRSRLLELARVAALAAVDVVDALGVGRAAEADGVVLVALAHGHGGHDDDLVRVAGAGLVGLGAADHDAVVALLDDVQVHVGVGLLVRRQAAVALGIGHGAVGDEVVVLQVLDVLLEALVVLGAARLVGLVGDRVQRVDGVHADAALEAGAGLLAQQALHLDLLGEVVGGLVDVGEAVDPLAGEVAGGQHEVLVLGLGRELVGHGDAVDAGADERVVDVVVDLLAEQVDLQVQIGEALDELLRRSESHRALLPGALGGSGAAAGLAGAGAHRCGSARTLVRCGGAEAIVPAPGALVIHYRSEQGLSQCGREDSQSGAPNLY